MGQLGSISSSVVQLEHYLLSVKNCLSTSFVKVLSSCRINGCETCPELMKLRVKRTYFYRAYPKVTGIWKVIFSVVFVCPHGGAAILGICSEMNPPPPFTLVHSWGVLPSSTSSPRPKLVQSHPLLVQFHHWIGNVRAVGFLLERISFTWQMFIPGNVAHLNFMMWPENVTLGRLRWQTSFPFWNVIELNESRNQARNPWISSRFLSSTKSTILLRKGGESYQCQARSLSFHQILLKPGINAKKHKYLPFLILSCVRNQTGCTN